jgi:hypothetical protein
MPEPHTVPEKVAIVIAADLGAGHAANVAACVAAGLASARPGWAGAPLQDAAGLESCASSHQPIAVLRAAPAAMASLIEQLTAAVLPDGAICLFPAYAQAMHDGAAYQARHGTIEHRREPLLAIGLAGSKRWVNRLTGSMPLWR